MDKFQAIFYDVKYPVNAVVSGCDWVWSQERIYSTFTYIKK